MDQRVNQDLLTALETDIQLIELDESDDDDGDEADGDSSSGKNAASPPKPPSKTISLNCHGNRSEKEDLGGRIENQKGTRNTTTTTTTTTKHKRNQQQKRLISPKTTPIGGSSPSTTQKRGIITAANKTTMNLRRRRKRQDGSQGDSLSSTPPTSPTDCESSPPKSACLLSSTKADEKTSTKALPNSTPMILVENPRHSPSIPDSIIEEEEEEEVKEPKQQQEKVEKPPKYSTGRIQKKKTLQPKKTKKFTPPKIAALAARKKKKKSPPAAAVGDNFLLASEPENNPLSKKLVAAENRKKKGSKTSTTKTGKNSRNEPPPPKTAMPPSNTGNYGTESSKISDSKSTTSVVNSRTNISTVQQIIKELTSLNGDQAPKLIKSSTDFEWLKEQQDAVEEAGSSDHLQFMELKNYCIVDSNGKMTSLLSIATSGSGAGGGPFSTKNGSSNGQKVKIYGQLVQTNLSAEVKPLESPTGRFVCLDVNDWGIWWVDPRPILYIKIHDIRLELNLMIELHHAHKEYRKAEEQSRYNELRKLVEITDIILFDFVRLNPNATLTEELRRAREDAPVDRAITLDDDDDDNDEDGGAGDIQEIDVESLHQLLMDRRGTGLVQLSKDEHLKAFLCRQLDTPSMKYFYQSHLIQELLKRDSEGRPVAPSYFDASAPWRKKLPQLAPEHQLVVTPRVRKSLMRLALDLLGNEADGLEYVHPMDVDGNSWGEAETVKAEEIIDPVLLIGGGGADAGGPGDGSNSNRNTTSFQFRKVRLRYGNGESNLVCLGDFVRAVNVVGSTTGNNGNGKIFMKVLRIWRTSRGKWKVHGLVITQMTSTSLTHCGSPSELMYTDTCKSFNLRYIEEIIKVKVVPAPTYEEWFSLSKTLGQDSEVDYTAKPTEYVLRYKHVDTHDTYTFEYLSDKEHELMVEQDCEDPLLCPKCLEKSKSDATIEPSMSDADDETVLIGGEPFRMGDFIYLIPDSVPLRFQPDRSIRECRQQIRDEVKQYVNDPTVKYPESRHYERKLAKAEYGKRLIEPYMIVRIQSVVLNGEGQPFLLMVNPYYRGSDIDFGNYETNQIASGSLEVFASEETVPFNLDLWYDSFRGLCYVRGLEDIKMEKCWITQGDDRFFVTRKVKPSPRKGRPMLVEMTTKELAELRPASREAPSFAPIPKEKDKLNSLELFCGAGGSSCGFEQSGIRTKVAVDMDIDAKETIKRNLGTSAEVFYMDSNEFLHNSLTKKESYPKPGDFDVVFGGPPCQGFSSMNRVPDSTNSKKKNTCVTTQLSAYDYFRPSYCILENVNGLLFAKDDPRSGRRTAMSNVITAVLLELGYQVIVYQLNAGGYGVPQTRNRVFIIGCAPTFQLPIVPKPKHCSTLPPFQVHGLNKVTVQKSYSAPLPELTVFDAISDLPQTKDGQYLPVVAYGCPPKTWFQKQLRGNMSQVTGHESRRLSMTERIRIEHLPAATHLLPEPDWRLLPNIDYEDLESGTIFDKLDYVQDGSDPKVYRYKCDTCPPDYEKRVKNRKMPNYNCVIPQKSILPGYLAHKSKCNAWADCYGRISYNLWFRTITTGDSLTRQAGRIIHPEQSRILTIRELARGQGFPDYWHFEGRMAAKIRQIGNAVPPPITRAIGRSIREAHQRSLWTKRLCNGGKEIVID